MRVIVKYINGGNYYSDRVEHIMIDDDVTVINHTLKLKGTTYVEVDGRVLYKKD